MTCQTPKGEVLGVPGRVPDDGKRYLHNQRMGLAVMRDRRALDTSFLYYLFLSPQFNDYLFGTSTGAKILHTAPGRIEDYRFARPPIGTQRKIASILLAYDDLINNNVRRTKVLEEMAQVLYREWFVDFRFPGHENVKIVESELGPMPVGWDIKRVASFGRVVTGKTPSTDRHEFFGSVIPFIKTPDMHGKVFCLAVGEQLSMLGADSQKTKMIPSNSLIVNCIGALAGSVSLTTEPSQTNQQINSLILNTQRDREFLFLSLKGLRQVLRQFGSNGATMINMNKEKFEGLRIITPAPNLLDSFHAITFEVFEQIRNLEARNVNLHMTRDLLLPRLMAGRMPVEATQDATAELIEQTA